MYIESLEDYLKREILLEYDKKWNLLYKSLNFNRYSDFNNICNNTLLEEEVKAKQNLDVIKNIKFPICVNKKEIFSATDIWYNLYINKFKNSICQYENQKKQISEKLYEEVSDKKSELNNIYDNTLIEYKNKLNDLFQPIYLIKENKGTIEKYASDFHIDLESYTIKFDNMTLKEIRDISNLSYKAIYEVIQGTRGFSSILKLLYIPLYFVPFSDKLENTIFKSFYIFLLIIILYSCKPWILGLISLFIIIQSIGNIFLAIKNKKLLCIAYSLNNCFQQFDNRITELLTEEPELKKIKEQYNEVDNLNLDKLIEENQLGINQKIEYITSKSPESDLKKQIEEIKDEKSIKKFMDNLSKIEKKYVDLYNKSLCEYENYCKIIDFEINKRAKNAYGPGIPVSADYFMDFSFKSSIAASLDGRIIGYDKTIIPFENILFQYKGDTDRQERINTLKLILSSIIGNVRENYLEIIIIDTKQLGRELTEFIYRPIRNIVKLVTDEWDKVFKDIVNTAKQNMLSIGTENFNEYNRLNSSEGKTTLEYKVIIVLSTDAELWNNKLFCKFKNYSTHMGVWLWLVHGCSELYQKDGKKPDGISELLNFPIIIDSPEFYEYGNKSYQLYQTGKFLNPLSYNITIGKNSVKALAEAIETGRIDIVDYETEYRTKHIPDNKIWSFSTLNGIELHFGFLDGDRSNPNIEWLGSDGSKPVHCLMAGETGAGKSATINQVLANLLYMYSPEQLELIMIDFKNVEFNLYTGDLLIPHAKIIAGTTDGEYALSIFEYLMSEMKRRQSEFAKYKFQNIVDWNTAVLDKSIEENYMPRILVLCDEFQVPFTEMESKLVDKLISLIGSGSKLMRFCGIHMWFTSQSMKGTVSQDILDQFTLRAALRSSYDTSVDILGNDAAFKKIKGRGYIYTNCAKGDINENHRYAIPFVSNKYIKEYLPKLIKKCRNENHIHRHADFYDEKKKHFIKELEKWYNTDAVLLDHTIFLGMKTYFSTNILPINFIVNKEDGEHIIIAASDRDDRYNIINTILTQLEYYKYEIIASCPDREFASVLELENRIPNEYIDFLYNNTADKLIQLIEQVIEVRNENPTKKWNPIYILNLMWDKILGIGIGDDYKIKDRYMEVIQKSASLNIHFIITIRMAKSFSFLLPYINHKICAQTDEDTSYKLLDSSKATKLSQDINISRMAIYIKDTKEQKFKIYQSPINKKQLKKDSSVLYL